MVELVRREGPAARAHSPLGGAPKILVLKPYTGGMDNLPPFMSRRHSITSTMLHDIASAAVVKARHAHVPYFGGFGAFEAAVQKSPLDFAASNL